MSKKDIKIALLYGGNSKEREISIKSGKAVENALKLLGYNYKVFDPVKGFEFIEEIKNYNPDLAFISLHGKGGEDGEIQSLLEFLGIKYTGSNPKTSAVCMDKVLTKKILSSENIPVPQTFSKDNIKFPVVVKPSEEGSSIGVYIANNKEDLNDALKHLKDYKNIIIEQFIKGREITVSILNGKILPIVEIVVDDGFYDYKNKYISSKTNYICPAEIDEKLQEKINKIAKKCWEVFNCKGAVRIDMIIDKNNTPYVLEINTIPGMTEHSLLPKAAKAIGLSFEELVNEIIEGALGE
ncbi:D-alanine--D-alanine ligase [Hydrogenivirga sp. 128-5-R1-1]|uniref:D-alanine--D-alanine ligase n=1 Tax=Hydrogenivirga sp. 128-5-R1-1 TaxID=392423 RepID=UPI00015F0E0D|nr:D-alanine--D-alanine ligase [Hydrogenivirga sp. 128-5-R1-1]EDP74258.1 D-alanine--D-alanine ligase [Hydrogenivirga sp. 128-5-R1-1]